MNLLLHLVHVLIFSSLNGYGYILFAANIDDFKTIAKKYMPEVFAEKLVEIASSSSLFDDGNKPKNHTFNIMNMPKKNIARSRPEVQPVQKGTVLDEDKEVTQTLSHTTPNNNEKNKKIPLSGIDLDELVEKIKQRLDKQYMEKYKSFMVNITSNIPKTVESKMIRGVVETQEGKGGNSLRKPKNEEYDYENREQANEHQPVLQPLIKNHQQQEDMEDVNRPEFEEKDLRYTNDSYEDYKIPPKYENKERNYPTKARNTNKVTTSKSPYKLNIVKKPKNYDYEVEHLRYDDVDGDDQAQNEEDKFKSSEIKAQTENLGDDNYDDKAIEGKVPEDTQHSYQGPQSNPKSYTAPDGSPNSYKASQGPQRGYKKKEVSRMIKGTGIPTRERFSMSSPNYYASVPIVAEKYDFNEPLPEQDREREDPRYLKNQPARINKKVVV